jgi:hypothetical protein
LAPAGHFHQPDGIKLVSVDQCKEARQWPASLHSFFKLPVVSTNNALSAPVSVYWAAEYLFNVKGVTLWTKIGTK